MGRRGAANGSAKQVPANVKLGRVGFGGKKAGVAIWSGC